MSGTGIPFNSSYLTLTPNLARALLLIAKFEDGTSNSKEFFAFAFDCFAKLRMINVVQVQAMGSSASQVQVRPCRPTDVEDPSTRSESQ